MVFDYLYLIIIVGFYIPISIIDIRSQKIPDFLNVSALISILTFKFIQSFEFLLYSLLSAVIAGLFFLLIRLISKGKLGFGDIKMSLSIGAVLGVKYWLISTVIASFTGIIFGFIMLLIKKIKYDSRIAFGPFLAFGCFISYIFKLNNFFH